MSDNDIYAKIRSAMAIKQVRQSQIAQLAGISRSYLSDTLAGNRSISPKMALAFERALGISARSILRTQMECKLVRQFNELYELRKGAS